MCAVTRRVKATAIPGARLARYLAGLRRVGIEQLFRLVVPCQTPRETYPRGRSIAVSWL